jgi:F-type H+-transporting ATPase subunit b
MSYLFQDPKFWLLISFITFIILMIKPFKSMMIGGLDSKIAEIKENINKSLESFTEAEAKLKDAEKQTEDLSNKIDEIIVNAKKQSESISKNIIDKTTLTIQSKEKNSIDRIKQIELSAVQSIKKQASIELNKLIFSYFSEISDDNKARMLNKSVADLKSIN